MKRLFLLGTFLLCFAGLWAQSVNVTKTRLANAIQFSLPNNNNTLAADSIVLFIDSLNSPSADISKTAKILKRVGKTGISTMTMLADTVTAPTRNTTLQFKVFYPAGKTVLSDTMVFWVHKLQFVIDAMAWKLPATVYLHDATINSSGVTWEMLGGSFVESTKNIDNSIAVQYKTPGLYDVKMYGSYGADDDFLVDFLAKDAISIPGIITRGTNDTIKLCANQSFILKGLSIEKWSDSSNFGDNFFLGNEWTVSPKKSHWYYGRAFDSKTLKLFTDSVYVLVDTITMNSLLTQKNCAGTLSRTVQLPTSIVSFTVDSKVYNNTNVYKLDSTITEVAVSEWTDILGCIIKPSVSLPVKLQTISYPVVYVYGQTICQSNGFTKIYSNLCSNPKNPLFEWYKGLDAKKILLRNDTCALRTKDSGYYTLRSGYDAQCMRIDTFSIRYQTAPRDSITSINYLPGVGYVSTYSGTYSSMGSMGETIKTFKRNYNGSTDSLFSLWSMNASNTFDKTRLLIDTLQYRAGDSLIPLTYTIINKLMMGGCPSATQTIKSGSPVRLIVRTDVSSQLPTLVWTPYTVSKVARYYIFRGTSIDSMKILKTVSANITTTKDDNPVAGAMYAVGVVDDFGGYQILGDMQYNWQKGFITSNISPIADGFKRNGFIAAYTTSAISENIFLRALAPSIDSVRWLIQNNKHKDSLFIGKTVSLRYDSAGKYDVTMIAVYKNGTTDTVKKSQYLTILPHPVKLVIDTIYKKNDGDSLVLDLKKYIKVEAKLSYVDAYLPYIAPTSALTIENVYNPLTKNSFYTFKFNTNLKDTIFRIPVIVRYQDTSWLHIKLVNPANVVNKAPFIKPIPTQVANIGWMFSPLNIYQYVSDDYTLPDALKYEVLTKDSVLSISLKNGVLSVWQDSLEWTGQTTVRIKITDANNLSNIMQINYLQTNLMKIPGNHPQVSFRMSKSVLPLGDSVAFYPELKGADSVLWTFDGGDTLFSKTLTPTVVYIRPGKHNVTLKAMNYHGSTEFTKTIDVWTSIEPRSKTICAGDSVTLSVTGSFKSYLWSNKQETTTSIRVAPTKTTTYKVTLKVSGAVRLYDSITLTVPTAANLGNDTSICQGASLILNPGQFAKYYWNDSTTLGKPSLTINKAGNYSVKTIDNTALACTSIDTIAVKINALPVIDLGADTVFCWKKNTITKTITASANMKSYLWNDAEKSTEQSITVDTTGTWTVTIIDKNGCQNADSLKTTARVPFTEQIGIVTQSEELFGGINRNLIAWQQTPNKDIVKYILYRETDIVGEFKSIDTIVKDELPIVIDKEVNPILQSWNYALKTVDACGNESKRSTSHNSINLACFITRGTTDSTVSVEWTQYNGLTVNEYIIYRKPRSGGDLKEIGRKKNTGESRLIYLDDKSLGMNAIYRVGFDIPDFKPIALKSDTGPFSQSLSNVSEVSLVSESNLELSKSFIVSPNPVNDFVEISSADNNGIKVNVIRFISSDGQIVLNKEVNQILNSTIIPIKGFAAGFYTIAIETNQTVQYLTLIVL